MKSIKSKLIVMVIAVTIVFSGVLGYIAFINSEKAVKDQLNESLRIIAIEDARLVSSRIEAQITFLETLSETKMITDGTPLEEKFAILQREADRMDYQSIRIVDLNGQAKTVDGGIVDVSDRDYYKLAAQGKSNVSDVLISKTTGQPIITYAVPVKRDNKVVGVLYGVRDGTNLSKITNDISFGENGSAFIVNNKGVNIANRNIDMVINQYNCIEDAKENKELVQTANIVENRMIKGETGVDQYFFAGESKMVGFAPVPGTEWSIGIEISLDEALKGVYSLRNKILIFSICLIFLGIGLAFYIGNSFAQPIINLTKLIERFANYDLTSDEKDTSVKYLKRKDEIGKVTNALATMQNSLTELIRKAITASQMVGATSQELSASVEEISSSAQNQASTTQEVSSSMEEMSANIHIVSENMHKASQNTEVIANSMAEVEKIVDVNTKNLEDINHSISEILTAIDGTSQSINTISDKSKIASKEAGDTVALASEGKGNLDRTVNQMSSIQSTILELSQVINGLGESASQIGDITDLIKDVAEQTNLLALNASIEAARAGEHGKGFAVVAQAIGNLAEESSNATKEITKVIKNIQTEIGKAVQNSQEGTKVVESGTHLVKETSNSLEKIFEAIQITSNIINDITGQMDLQSKETHNVYVSANDINGKVNNLMAAMEEETAENTEIKGKIDSLNHLIGEISVSMEQQSAASEQVSGAINENAVGIQEISTSSEEIAKSAEQLANNAQELIEEVQQFKI